MKIKSITIDGYKCLRNAVIETGALNIFAGPNSSGKSSTLQALLLLRQSADKQGCIERLRLSGNLYEAGTADDVLHPAAEHQIHLSILTENDNVEMTFLHDRSYDSAAKRSILATHRAKLPESIVGDENLFAYLNAERLGPRLAYPLPPEEARLGGLVGKFGELTPAILSRAMAGRKVSGWDRAFLEHVANAAQVLDGKDLYKDLENTDGRLDLVCNVIFGWVIPGASFHVAENDQTDSASLRYGRQVLSSTATTRATHSGFGLTYTLPIITAALGILDGGVLIVENPEAHLPPYSQSRIGVFLAMLAAMGRQIFVETHSDHVVNGIRLAVKNSLISHDDVFFNFFNKDSTQDTSEIIKIRALPTGRLNKWPEGFFDQIESDLSKL